MTIQSATWSGAFTCTNPNMDRCHKCRQRVAIGEQYKFIGGWNTARVLCQRCGKV